MQLGSDNDDFQVREIPLYPASGSGEHLHLRVRKRNLSTPALVTAIARSQGLSERNVGYAGRKDRHALTEQDITVYRGREEALSMLADQVPSGATVEILAVSRHQHKLRSGHCLGNAFSLRITAVTDAQELAALASRQAAEGIANLYGPQRYGRHGINLQQAHYALNTETKPSPKRRRQQQYAADAGQAAIFDAVVTARRQAGLLHRLRVGDVAMLGKGACFLVTAGDCDEANQRLANGELTTTGPLPGDKLLRAQGPCADDEVEWSAGLGIPWAAFDRDGPLASSGGRRSAVINFLVAPTLRPATASDDSQWLDFSLSSGSYATTVCSALNIGLGIATERYQQTSE